MESPTTRLLRALDHRQFRLWFLGSVSGQTGFWFSHLAFQALVVEITANDTRQVGWLFFALFLPTFLLAPIAGDLADRFDRRRLLLASYTAVMVLASCLGTLVGLRLVTVPLLLGFAVAMGSMFALQGPAASAITANTVPRSDLASAISLHAMANNATRIAGPLLVAPLLAGGMYGWCFAAYAVGAGITVLFLMRVRVEPHAFEAEGSGLQRLTAGWRHAGERSPALAALFTAAVLSLFGVSHLALLPSFCEEVLGRTEVFATLVSASGVGALFGALRVGTIGRAPTLRRSAGNVAAYGVALAVFASTELLIVAVAMQLVIGFFYFATMTGLQTLVQELVDDRHRGRVMSLFKVAWGGLLPFGGLALGQLAAWVGLETSLFAGAIVCVAFGSIMALAGPTTPTIANDP